MRRRPPRSTRTDTLFPYTTLFRSARHLAPLSPLDAGLILMPGQTATQAANDDLRSLSALELHHQVTQFLYQEARLQDLHDYDGWEALWEDDAIYWVPANGHDTDPEKQMSIL